MNLATISTVFRKELREMLRDRRSLAIMFGIPLLLYPVLTVTLAGVVSSKTQSWKDQPARVAVTDPPAAPHLVGALSEKGSGVEVSPSPDPAADLRDGKIHAVIELPPEAERRALAGESAELIVRIDSSRTEAAFAQQKLTKVFDAYDRWVLERRLADRGVPATVLAPPLTRTTHDVATGDQRLGKILALALPLIVLITGMLGAFFPALNATTTERELGTLETLLVTPAGRTELLVAKAGIVLLSGLLTAALNLVSMSLVLWRTLSGIDGKASLGPLAVSPAALLVTYLAAVPTLVTFSALVLIVGLLARTFREANSLATPVMLIPMLSLLVGIAEPAATPALLVTPVANTTIIIRDALVGRVQPWQFALAFASSCLYAGLMLSVASRLFTSEQLVNPAWEPVSWSSFRRAGASRVRAPRPRHWPPVDGAMAVFAVTVLLSFYVQPSLQWAGLVPLTAASQIMIAGPAVLAAWAWRWKWRESFSWRRPGAAGAAAGVLIGIGMCPWINLFSSWQGRWWPADPRMTRLLFDLIAPPLLAHPFAVPLLIGVLAGAGEELLYRGPLQAALSRKLPPWAVIAAVSFLFAAAHFDLHGLPARVLIGAVLGWLVVRTGSIFPSMLCHAAFDATQLYDLALSLHRHGAAAVLQADAQPESLDRGGVGVLVLGALLLTIGVGLVLLRRPPRPEPEAFPA